MKLLEGLESYGENAIGLFTAQFGRTLNDCPEIFPSFNNYYQDINVGGSRLGNLTRVNGVLLFPASNPNAEYPDFEFRWYLNGVLVSTLGNPRLSDIKPEGCSGVMRMRLEVIHKPTMSYGAREEWCYLQYLDLAVCEPQEDAPSQFGVFVPFYPAVNPREEYMGLAYDFNGDGVVNVTDLTIFLSRL